MEATSNLKVQGQYTIRKYAADGTPLKLWQENKLGYAIFKLGADIRIPGVTGSYQYSYTSPNLVVNAGLAFLATLLSGSGTVPTYVALGSGSTAVQATDTTLGTELSGDGLTRAEGTVTTTTTTVTGDTFQITETFTYSGSTTKTINELGVFNASSNGTMLSRTVITAKTVDTSGETLAITYKLVYANA